MFTYNDMSASKVYTKIYKNLLGVDMSAADTNIDERRSSYAPNMIANKIGMPEKRCGYTPVHVLPARINGLCEYLSAKGVKKMIVHSGSEVYIFDSLLGDGGNTENKTVFPEDGNKVLLYSGVNDSQSFFFNYSDKLYMIDGENYLVYDGSEMKSVEDDAYVPTTVINADPTGGGVLYEYTNLIQKKRINSFLATANDTVYQLDTVNISGVLKVEKRVVSGNADTWQEVTGYTVDGASGKVTFSQAIGVSPVEGEDNLRITFEKEVSGYAERIKNCRFGVFYGIGNDRRVFLSGNDKYPNYDFYCANRRADYFPDLNYNIVGADGNPIMGYLNQYEELVIVKKNAIQDSGIYVRNAVADEKGETIFITKQGLGSVGAISVNCFANFYGDNIFLSDKGVLGLDTYSSTMQKTLQDRSIYVNAALLKEADLKDAVSCVYGGLFMIFVNGKVYIADSKQKNDNGSGSYGYEWYYWTDVPAKKVLPFEGRLYFGGDNGILYKFKDPIEVGDEAFCDEDIVFEVGDDGETIENNIKKGIYSCWMTKCDGLGDISRYKRITKRNVGIISAPYAKTSGRIIYIGDKETVAENYFIATLFDFNNVDFNEFSFGVLSMPKFIAVNTGERRIKMFSVRIENDSLCEPFGIYQIMLSYTYGKNIK